VIAIATRPADVPGLEATWGTPRGWRGTLSSVDHKTIGLRYLVTSIFFLVVGGVEALVMRTQLA
jgi:heme/copper-type cytochrome/quinol oxidase subunit 1